jgi:hypothetical protein
VLSGGASVGDYYEGYSGTGFVDGYWNDFARTTFTVNVVAAGNYNVILRYANAYAETKKLTIVVNGVSVAITNMVNSGPSWENWANQAEILSLNSGINTIAYLREPYYANAGNVNLDYISVPTSPTAAVPTPTPIPTSTPIPTPTATPIPTPTPTPLPLVLDGSVIHGHNNGGNLSLPVTVNSRSNQILLFALGSHQGGGSVGASSVTYGGVAMTKVATRVGFCLNGTSGCEFVQLWILSMGSTSKTGNIVTSGLSGGGFTFGAAYRIYNAKQTTTVITNTRNGGSCCSTSVNLTPQSANNWIIDVVEAEPRLSAGGSNIQDYAELGQNAFDNGAGSTIKQAGGPAAVSMIWILSYGARWNQAAVAIEPAP